MLPGQLATASGLQIDNRKLVIRKERRMQLVDPTESESKSSILPAVKGQRQVVASLLSSVVGYFGDWSTATAKKEIEKLKTDCACQKQLSCCKTVFSLKAI